MALFGVNTGCRDQEICNLRWNWEVKVPELDTSVFIVPRSEVKNEGERLVVLNSVALSVINARRGVHPRYVFTYRGQPIDHMLNNGWRAARVRAGLAQVRVHDLKHTFGRRLRAAGVNFEGRHAQIAAFRLKWIIAAIGKDASVELHIANLHPLELASKRHATEGVAPSGRLKGAVVHVCHADVADVGEMGSCLLEMTVTDFHV